MQEIQENKNVGIRKGFLIGSLIALFSFSVVLMVGSGNEDTLTTPQSLGSSHSTAAPLDTSLTQQVELRVDIRYTRAENVSLFVGFKRLDPSVDLNEPVQVTEEKAVQIYDRGNSLKGTGISFQAREHMLNEGIHQKWMLADFGFTSGDFPPAPQQLVWVLRIEDHNEERWENNSGELSHDRGVLEWFNISLGDTTYVSQLHPVFVAGMTCEAKISGHAGEIHKVVRTAPSKTQGIRLATPDYDEEGTATIGVASVVSIVWFKHNDELYQNYADTNEFIRILDDASAGRWKIYYLNAPDQVAVDDGDIEWMMEKLDWETGAADQPDQALLWINSHGWGSIIWSTNTNDLGTSNRVTLGEAKDRISWITDEGGIKLFYWACTCYSDQFWDNMEFLYGSGFHHNRVLSWSYHSTHKTGMRYEGRELWAFNAHMDAYGASPANHPHALEWMYSNGFYWMDWDSQYYPSIRSTVQGYGEDLIQRDFIGSSHLFNLAPKVYTPSVSSLTPDCRSINPSQHDDNGRSWTYYRGSNYATISETAPYGTFLRYVGYWLEVQTFDKDIYVRFDGRAMSTYSGPSMVTHLRVVIYDASWTSPVQTNAIVTTSTDSGLINNLRVTLAVDGPVGNGDPETFYVYLCFGDGWSYIWGNWIYIRNVKIIA